MEHEDIVIAIKELDKSLNCISFDPFWGARLPFSG